MGLPEYMARRDWTEAYWEHMAKYGRRKRVWRSGWDHWALTLSSDELNRRTLVVGPWVVALWNCRCSLCKADERHLLDILDAPVEPEPPAPTPWADPNHDIMADLRDWHDRARRALDETHYTTEGWHPAALCQPGCPSWKGEPEP